MKRGFLIICAFAAASCSASSTGPGNAGLDVLFIGNSLTATNDLPRTVAAIATAAGETIRVTAVTQPNFALIDHVNNGSAISMIRRGGWDFVVLQQGPTSTGPGPDRDTLVIATRRLDQEIRAVGARTALYMVWPTRARLEFFDNTRDAYQLAATEVNGLFLPAGEAWRTAWQNNPNLQFYGADDFHPSPLGTFLAALVIYEAITNKDVRQTPARAFAGGNEMFLSQETIRALQTAAHETVVQFR